MNIRSVLLAIFFAFSVAFGPDSSHAGVFSMPRFVQNGDWAIGLEPEVVLTSGAGIGANVKYTSGLNDLMNLTATLGSGSGPRRFRIGGNLTFDFFPDIEGQPGIGLGTQAQWIRLREHGALEMTAVPYIHKTFISDKNEVEPFLAFPFGVQFFDGNYRSISTMAVGAMFKTSEHVRTVLEFGMAINNTESYLSGGLIYYP